MSGPSLARGKVQTLPPPSEASRPLLNLHFESFSWTRDLQATATHPPSLPLPVPAAPPTGPQPTHFLCPFHPLAAELAILSLWPGSFSLPAAPLLRPPCLPLLFGGDYYSLLQKNHPKSMWHYDMGTPKAADLMLELPTWKC